MLSRCQTRLLSPLNQTIRPLKSSYGFLLSLRLVHCPRQPKRTKPAIKVRKKVTLEVMVVIQRPVFSSLPGEGVEFFIGVCELIYQASGIGEKRMKDAIRVTIHADLQDPVRKY